MSSIKRPKWRQIHRVGKHKTYRCMNCGLIMTTGMPIRYWIQNNLRTHDCDIEIIKQITEV
jgi:uncharacterized Zn finger protein